ncbi:hypothetical protein [Corynebacterium dentalis]|nr:hypothetical protein [Corynebacterium dentalis]
MGWLSDHGAHLVTQMGKSIDSGDVVHANDKPWASSAVSNSERDNQ